jgi:hypothetical protein
MFTLLILVFAAVLGPPLVHATSYTFEASLTADQVVAGGGSTSTATGFATFIFDTTLLTITTDMSWAGLSGPTDRSHMHDGPLGGVSSDIFFNEVLKCTLAGCVVEDGSPFVSCFAGSFCREATGWVHNVLDMSIVSPLGCQALYADCDAGKILQLLQTGGVYIDLHTELYPGGEIRGQIYPSVPEPSSLWLLMSGGMVLAAIGLRRHLVPSRGL